jgi:hypothetical protein
MATFPSIIDASNVWDLTDAYRAQAGGNWPPLEFSDPYFNYTTLLLHGNGVNGSQNNTFLDSSTNNFTITRNGNTTQGAFSPYSSNWSNYFDGTGDRISVSSSTAFALGTGDFTIEMWVKGEGNGAGPFAPNMLSYPDGTDKIQFWMGIPPSNSGGPVVYVPGLGNFYSGLGLNSFIHVAVTRQSGTARIFFNGVLAASGTYSANIPATDLTIGDSAPSLNAPFNGYISNLRIVKGTAVYTANFTPPSVPLTAITNTSLLTCQSNRFIDNSTNAFAITVNGNASVRPFSPFQSTVSYSADIRGGSAYFDGSGDYLMTPASSLFGQLSTGNFTVEGWVYPTTDATGTIQTVLQIASGSSALSNTVLKIVYWNGGGSSGPNGALGAAVGVGSAQVIMYLIPPTSKSRSWTHFALVKNGSTFTFFQNGVLGQSYSSTFNSFASATLSTGANIDGTEPFTGYVSDLRVTNQVGYTTSFTPPTIPLGVVTNTHALLNFTNAGILDNTMMNNLETKNSAQISTTQSKFGGSSIRFNIPSFNGDALVSPANARTYEFGSGDFTIESWVYPTSTSNNAILGIPYSLGSSSVQFYISSASSVGFAYRTTATPSTLNNISGSTSLTTNQWYHMAVSRSGNILRIFVNGNKISADESITGSILYEQDMYLAIGSADGGSSNVFYGYLDDLRITKGLARYTANFTPPTRAFENK